MCIQDYEFHVLSNAFLIHRPGIKELTTSATNNSYVIEQDELVKEKILPQLEKLYGTREGCQWKYDTEEDALEEDS